MEPRRIRVARWSVFTHRKARWPPNHRAVIAFSGLYPFGVVLEWWVLAVGTRPSLPYRRLSVGVARNVRHLQIDGINAGPLLLRS